MLAATKNWCSLSPRTQAHDDALEKCVKIIIAIKKLFWKSFQVFELAKWAKLHDEH